MVSTHALTQAGLNLIQQALTIYDSDLKLAVCNRRFAEMFDLPDRLTNPGASFQDTIRHLAERGEYGEVGIVEEFVRDRVDTALAFEPHYMERTRANGQTISVEGAPLPQGGWVTVYTDITQMKAQEQLLRTRSELLSGEVLARSEELAATNRNLAATISALEEARRQLTEMEARARLTTEMMPAHIARVDATGHYTYSNRRLTTIMPGRPSDILGLHISDALGSSAYARVQPFLEAAFEGDPSTFEFTDIDSSRRIRVAFTPDETERGVYILSMDMTEETQARVALQQTRRREIAAQLVSGLAHDFSNLLTIILGTQSKLRRMELGPQATPLIAATQQAAERGGVLLNRIADMTGPRTYAPQPVDIAQFLSDVEVLASASLPETTQLQVICEVDTPLLLDRGMVQDSLLNLVLNARDAVGDHGGTICLTCRTVMNTWVELILQDDGPGFSQEALAHGLDPFFTTKGSKGSGLGLAMVYDMAKLSGGNLRIANTAQGAEVRIRLPLRRAAADTSCQLVLLVEDEPDLRANIRDMLTEQGHTVIEAASVVEAETLARSLPDIGLVLTDIVLEGDLTGVELRKRLPNCKVALMSSLPRTDPRIVALQDAAILRKPFTESQLSEFVSLALGEIS